MGPALASDPPMSAADLNAYWAAVRLPFRLDRRGVAQLWAVYPAGADTQHPLLFIIGNEKRAVRQAQRWAATASLATLPVGALPVAAAAAAA